MRRLSLVAGGLLLLYAIVGFLVAPPIVRSQLEKQLAAALHRPVTVERVRINPFAPSVSVQGLAVAERDGSGTFIGFDELYVNAAWSSIVRRAPVLDEVTLTRPRVHVVRYPDRRYNFQDLLDQASAPAEPSGAPPMGYALFNLQLVEGSVDFDDRAADRRHTVRDLRIGVPFLSSLPANAQIKVLPELSGTVNGAHFGIAGDTLPYAGTYATHLKLDADGFDLTKLLYYLPFEPRAKLQSGLLDTRLVITFEQPPGKPAELKLAGSAGIRNLAVLAEDGEPAFAWRRLAVELNQVEPLAARFDLKSVQLDAADVHLRREKSGTFSLARLGPRPAPAQAPKKEEPAAPLALKIDSIALDFERFAFTDQTTAPAFRTTLAKGEIRARGFDLQPGKRSEWTLNARSDAGETIQAAAGLAFGPLSVDGRVDVAGIVLKRYQPYVEQGAALRIEGGEADAGLAFSLAGDAFKAQDVSLAVRDLRARLPAEKQPFVRVGALEVKGAGVDLATRTATIGELAMRKWNVALNRDKDGVLNVSRIARPSKETAPAAPWRVDLAHAAIDSGGVAFEDLSVGEPVSIVVSPLALTLDRLSTARGQRGNASLRAGIGKTGRISASGPVSLDPLALRLNVDVREVSFAPLQPYLEEKLHLALTSGALSGKGTASFEMPAGGAMNAGYQGDIAVTDFASIDKRSMQDLVKWKSLALGAVDFGLEPLKVSVGEVALSEYYARIILAADGRLNLQDLVVAPAEKSAPAEPSAPADIRIGRIIVQGGNVNFSDFFVRPNYRANLTELGGSVSEMSADKAADVDLRGKLGAGAPVQVAGKVNPLSPELVLHIKGSAKEIELPPLSPYAVKYAGHGIESGKLSLEVSYDVEARKLDAQNRIYLDQLTFGERVESPTATKLPVTFAVSLLKDSNGVIDINLPISGSLDDPQFSLGGVIGRAIGNLVARVVTAPFAVLGSMFGGGGQDLAYLEFAPGSAELAESEQAKMKTLAGALGQRPGLRLDISGRALADPDREALKHAALQRKVRAQKFNELRRAGAAPASVDEVRVEAAEYEKYLRLAYRDEKFPKPRNALGFAKDLPVAEMENLILASITVEEDDLRALAEERAEKARDWLVHEAKVAPERIFTVAPKLSGEGIKDKGRPTRVDFALK